jgi:DNA-binding response OmpR family regulator
MANILLIESDKILAGNIIKAFKNAKHSVDWQVDPQVALNSADSQLPQAIILDLVLANRSGVEFLYEFRSYPDWQNIPVILFSSLSPDELTESAGGFEHLNITTYHYKPNTSLVDLAATFEKSLQVAVK